VAIVIDGLKLVNSKKRLPKEAFFVDTNVVIDFKDPLGRTNDSPNLADRHAEVSLVVSYLKSSGTAAFATLGVVLEYYKNIQNGFYLARAQKKKFDNLDFKKRRDSDFDFMAGWDLQVKALKRTFTRNFPLYDTSPAGTETLLDFQGSSVDFGDHLLYATVMTAPERSRCVFSNDGDFYSFPDDLYLLTTNVKVIGKATEDGKLYKPN
jgi:hypothetical protein